MRGEVTVRPPGRSAEARTSSAALALRLAGATYDEVADALGLPSAENARDLTERALAARADLDRNGRDRLRAENGARLERLMRGVWQKAIDPEHPDHLVAVRVARELVDRHCKLYGLDAPSELIVHAPTAAEIDAWVAGMVAEQTKGLRAMEAAVVEAEVIEDTAEAS
jgi:hypothetical protein